MQKEHLLLLILFSIPAVFSPPPAFGGSRDFRLTKRQISSMNVMQKDIFEKLTTQFGDPNLPPPQYASQFHRDRAWQLNTRTKVIGVKRTLGKHTAKAMLKQSQEASNSQSTCVNLCAWASAWTQATCFARACAWCPGGKIWFCANATSTSYAYSMGYACMQLCDSVNPPKCEG